MIPIPPEIREYLSYNPETGICTWLKSPRRISVGSEAGTSKNQGHRVLGFQDKKYQLHRVIWYLYYGEDPGDKHIDHINGVKDDNRISNLRLVTHQQNCQNRCSAKGIVKNGNGWNSQITVNGTRHYLGRFNCPLLAGIAYQEAKAQLHTYT